MRHGPTQGSAPGRDVIKCVVRPWRRRVGRRSGTATTDYQQTGTPVGVVAGMPVGIVALP